MGSDTTIAFIVIGLPVILGVWAAVFRHALRHGQVKMLMEERRLLIEKGVTNLPKLELPQMSEDRRRGRGLADLRAGLVFVFAAGATLAHNALYVAPVAGPKGSAVEMGIALVLGGIGLALLVFHFISAAQAHRDDEARSVESLTDVHNDTHEERMDG